MAIVVDASALGAIAFGEPEGPTLAAYLEGETLLAPALLDFELASIALKKGIKAARVKKSPEALASILVAVQVALKLPIQRVPVPALDVVALAAETGLTAYDASYLWVARSRDAELVTLDKFLLRHASA